MESWKEISSTTDDGQSKTFFVSETEDSSWGVPLDINGSPLPAGWKRAYSETKKKYYYYDPKTRKSQWNIPSEPTEYYKNLLDKPEEPLQENIVVQQRCCDRPTQFPARMRHCESKTHTTGALLSIGASYLSEQNSNLDGIVEIRNATNVTSEPTFEGIKYLDNDNPYISDHNGISLYLSVNSSTKSPMNFNIISCNLEGLCRTTESDRKYRIGLIKDYFKDFIMKGTIMICQEIVLQILAKSKLSLPRIAKPDEEEEDETFSLVGIAEERKWVDIAGEEIGNQLQTLNSDFIFKSDSYTGGIFYDSSVWRLEKTIDISRLYNKKLESKFSNAYLFSCISTRCIFWVVNIHLKAFPPGSTEHTLDFIRGGDNVNTAHIIELSNIIGKLLVESTFGRIPIYLCGDYNNNSPKLILVEKAIEEYVKSSSLSLSSIRTENA